jgi:hypothetical protein
MPGIDLVRIQSDSAAKEYAIALPTPDGVDGRAGIPR